MANINARKGFLLSPAALIRASNLLWLSCPTSITHAYARAPVIPQSLGVLYTCAFCPAAEATPPLTVAQRSSQKQEAPLCFLNMLNPESYLVKS